MTRRSTRWLVATLTVVAIAIGSYLAMGGDTASESTTDARILFVSTIEIELVNSYTTQRTYTGTLVAARSADLSFERSGEIVAIDVDQGDRVAAGQALARLDTRHLIARQRQLQAQHDQAAAVLAELEAGPRQETIAAARAELRNLEAQVELQQLNTTRREELHRRKAIAQEDYDSAIYGLKIAEAQRDAARHRLDELLEGTRKEKVDAQRAAVAQLDAALTGIRADLEDCELVARFDGTIVKRSIDEGSVVQPGQPILRIVEHDRLEAWIGLPSSTAERTNRGTPREVVVDGQRHSAEVRAVLPELDSTTRTRRVVLTMDQAESTGIYSGQIARLPIDERIDVQGFWLPTAALVRGSRGLWSCFVVVADSAGGPIGVIEQREIEVLHTEGERALVRGMLEGNDVIVSEGVHKVVPGQRVRSRV